MDTLDFLEIYYDTKDTKKVLDLLSNKAGIIYLDARWRKKEREKYESNVKESMHLEWLSLSERKLVEPLMNMYRALNEEGVRHLGPMNLSSGNTAMFFASVRYMGEKIGVSSSQASRLVLMLEATGLIKRASDDMIPGEYLEMSRAYAGVHKRISYFMIRDIIKDREEILHNINMSIGEKVKISNISQNKLVKLKVL